MRDARVVAAFGKRPHSGALDIPRPHARHLEQRHVGTFSEHGIDARGDVSHEEGVALSCREAEHGAAIVDVEHIPRPDHHQRNIVARSCGGPLLLPALADREVVAETHRTLNGTRVVHAAPVDAAVDHVGERSLDADGQVDRQGIRLRVADDRQPRRRGQHDRRSRRCRGSRRHGTRHRWTGSSRTGSSRHFADRRRVSGSIQIEHRVVAPFETVELINAHIEQQQRSHERGAARERPVGDGRPIVPPTTDRPFAHRRLQVSVRRLGDHHGEQHRPREPPHRARRCTHDHEDRPAPQVQPVTSLAHLDQRGPAHDAPEPERCRVHGHHHSDQRQDRHERQQPLVHVALGEHGDRGRATEHRHRGSTEWIEDPAGRRVGRMRPSPWSPQERGAGAEQETACTGDRREVQEIRPVDALECSGWTTERRRCARMHPEHVGEHHERRSHDCSTDHVAGNPHSQQRHENEWPDQVPLLLDSEAPKVSQQRWLAGEVRHVAEDLTPVVDVEHRPRDVATYLRLLLGRTGNRRPDRHGEQHGVERREESTGAPEPELAERHLAVAVALVEQQRGDQEPRHHEEHLDAEESAVHPREPGVVQQDDADRQRT